MLLEKSLKFNQVKTDAIEGSIVTLVPVNEHHNADIARLRNQEKAKYFLRQQFTITPEQQKQWMHEYTQRENEFGFIIKNKREQVIGIMFLYNYTGTRVEVGRVVFDLEKIMGKPYELEASTLLLDLAFDVLTVDEVIAIVKEDNSLIRFNEKLGFVKDGKQEIRGATYIDMILSTANRNYKELNSYIESWKVKNDSSNQQ